MAYVPVPKDLNAVKTKVMFNLTKRQILCFGGGALIGVPLFFLLKGHIGSSAAALCMMLVMLPFFLLAMYEKNGHAGEAHPQHRAGVLPAPQTAPVQDEQFLRPAEPAGYFG